MKKAIFLVAACALLVACDTKKKDRLVADTLQVNIDPSTAISVVAGSTVTLKALCRSAKAADADVTPTWSIENNLGTFSPAQGKSTVFTAGTTVGTGKVYATAGAVRSTGVPLTVTAVGSSGGGGGGGTLKYVLLSDTQSSALLKIVPATASDIIFSWSGGGASIAISEVSGCPVDPAKANQLVYTNAAGGWGGINLAFNAAQDLSAYSSLCFYVKGAIGGEIFKVGMNDGTDRLVLINTVVPVTTSWQKVTIPFNSLTGLNKTAVVNPFIVAFTNADTAGNATISIDYIGFE